jgi:hypothetical protein
MRTVMFVSWLSLCPLGGFAFYHHYLHDVKDITKVLKIDWSLNKSWRQVMLLFFLQFLLSSAVDPGPTWSEVTYHTIISKTEIL